MEITIYRRHSAGCKHKDDRYHPRCGCSLWFQFNWTEPEATLDGNKVRRGQNKWSAETRIWSEAQTNAKRLKTDLETLLEGKPVRQNVAVKTAVDKWLGFRSKNGLTSAKDKLMGDKLATWCEKNDVVLLTAMTTERAMEFRMSLPRTERATAAACLFIGQSSGVFSVGLSVWATSKEAQFRIPGSIRSSALSTSRERLFHLPSRKWKKCLLRRPGGSVSSSA